MWQIGLLFHAIAYFQIPGVHGSWQNCKMDGSRIMSAT